MLVLTLRYSAGPVDYLMVDTPSGQIKIEILKVVNGKVRVGIHAGDEVTVQRKKVYEHNNGTQWERVLPQMSSAWTHIGTVDGWEHWEDAKGRLYRVRGRVWQMKVEAIGSCLG